ncbi:MAG: hypothetical protein ASARMPREDX12_000997 [Alectoria sarmentosa]|nr:MAG: hypothetical protein ASARMPREDX12_000997 [Alectoria sarmentosa]
MAPTGQPAPGSSLDETAAAPPPPGVVPNFINPENQASVINATLIICLSVATVFVWLRMYTRFLISKSHGHIFHGMVKSGFVGYNAITVCSSRYSNGNHIWDVTITREVQWLKLSNAVEIIYGPLLFITKLSILLLYIRIFVPTHRGARFHWIKFLIWSNFLFYFADTLVEIFQCVPRTKIWNPTIPGRCVNVDIAFVTTAAVNVVSDFSILLLPLICIWQLQMPTRRKLTICAVFAAGLFCCMASIMRLFYSIRGLHSQDPNYDLVPVALWTSAEIASGILCGCLPVLPQFFHHLVPKMVAKISTFRLGKSLSKKFSSNSNTGRAAPWEEPFDPRLHQGTYLELGELDRTLGPSTVIHGGKQDSMADVQKNGKQARDTEKEPTDGRILRTVRVERSSS